MADVVSICIAGVRFVVYVPGDIPLEPLAPCYAGFRSAESVSPVLESIDVSLRLGLPPFSRARQVFDGQSWWLYAPDGQRRQIGLGEDPSRLRWLAEFSLPLAQVEVHCRSEQVGESAKYESLANPMTYPLDQLLLVYVLAGKGLLIHAAGARIDGKGFLFAGSSGAGKSTLARSLAAAGCTELLSDDRMVVREVDGRLMAFGTPWPGDAGIAKNGSIPLDALFFIHHGAQNRIRALTVDQALRGLLPVCSIHWYEPDLLPAELSFAGRLLAGVPCFRLDSQPGAEVVRLLEGFDPASPPEINHPVS